MQIWTCKKCVQSSMGASHQKIDRYRKYKLNLSFLFQYPMNKLCSFLILMNNTKLFSVYTSTFIYHTNSLTNNFSMKPKVILVDIVWLKLVQSSASLTSKNLFCVSSVLIIITGPSSFFLFLILFGFKIHLSYASTKRLALSRLRDQTLNPK